VTSIKLPVLRKVIDAFARRAHAVRSAPRNDKRACSDPWSAQRCALTDASSKCRPARSQSTIDFLFSARDASLSRARRI
jgi:hypothetical protein